MAPPPTTFRAEPADTAPVDRERSATLHRSDDKGGLLNDFKAIRSGSLSEMIRHLMALPPGERRRYAIDKAGDHRLDYCEIAGLAARRDFPGGRLG